MFADAGFFFWHTSVNAVVVGGLPLLLVLVGWLGRAPRHILWLAAAVPGLTALQSLRLLPYHMNAQGGLRAISGLHVLNAIFIFWVALRLVERARDWVVAAASAHLATRPAALPGAVLGPGPEERHLDSRRRAE